MKKRNEFAKNLTESLKVEFQVISDRLKTSVTSTEKYFHDTTNTLSRGGCFLKVNICPRNSRRSSQDETHVTISAESF